MAKSQELPKLTDRDQAICNAVWRMLDAIYNHMPAVIRW